MKHKCAANGDDHRLEISSDGKWYLNRHWDISFCPYCGAKLNEPLLKSDVERYSESIGQARQEIVDKLRACMQQVEDLLSVDLEPPDVKIEVSRKMLRSWAAKLEASADNPSSASRYIMFQVAGHIEAIAR